MVNSIHRYMAGNKHHISVRVALLPPHLRIKFNRHILFVIGPCEIRVYKIELRLSLRKYK